MINIRICLEILVEWQGQDSPAGMITENLNPYMIALKACSFMKAQKQVADHSFEALQLKRRIDSPWTGNSRKFQQSSLHQVQVEMSEAREDLFSVPLLFWNQSKKFYDISGQCDIVI
jgi:hypothetical protein